MRRNQEVWRRAGRRTAVWIVGVVCAVVWMVTATAARADGAPESTDAIEAETEVSPSSPRAALSSFFELTRAGRLGEAARILDLPEGADGPRTARRLKAVLDANGRIDLARVSHEARGDAEDKLPPLIDEITVISGPDRVEEPVRMKRTGEGDKARWVFSRPTVAHVDAWYDRLENRWILDHVPAPLLRSGPWDVLWWQWIAMPVLVFLAWIAGRVLSFVSSAVLGRLASRTAWTWDEAILERIGKPLTLAWGLVAMLGGLPYLGLFAPADASVRSLIRTAFFVAFFWALMRTIGVVTDLITQSAWSKAHESSRSLVPLGARVGKVVVVALAIVAVLSDLGYPVASLIAGLGVGGLAVALAAQKTVENLFGAFSIGLDQPFREGDFVKIEDFVGTVEAIGLRSTRVRTLDRTLISIPNGKLAEMRLESYTARDRLRLSCVIGVVYETNAAQMAEILEGIERVLRDHPQIWPDAVVVRFKEFGASSLDIEVMAWFTTTEWNEFTLIRQQLLLQFMSVVEEAGSSFAFPTRTLHLAQAPSPAPAPA
ncbi:MAG: mechanosensitive ion channel family protein [Byssovorax sp.]